MATTKMAMVAVVMVHLLPGPPPYTGRHGALRRGPPPGVGLERPPGPRPPRGGGGNQRRAGRAAAAPDRLRRLPHLVHPARAAVLRAGGRPPHPAGRVG